MLEFIGALNFGKEATGIIIVLIAVAAVILILKFVKGCVKFVAVAAVVIWVLITFMSPKIIDDARKKNIAPPIDYQKTWVVDESNFII